MKICPRSVCFEKQISNSILIKQYWAKAAQNSTQDNYKYRKQSRSQIYNFSRLVTLATKINDNRCPIVKLASERKYLGKSVTLFQFH